MECTGKLVGSVAGGRCRQVAVKKLDWKARILK